MKMDDYSKYYIQGSDHYLIPKDVFKEIFQEMVNWRQEAQHIEKSFSKNFGDMSIDELKDFVIELQEENLRYERKISKLEASEKARKEAIKILKECLQLSPHEFDWEEQAENVINKLDIDKGDD